MKDFINFFSIITGLFRSIISILLLFLIGFVVFVDTGLLLSAFDLIGLNNISAGLIKPLNLVALLIAFLANTAITKNIFKAGKTGDGHLGNVFFGLIFLAIDIILYLYFREKLLLILLGFNGLIVINSLIGLIANLKGTYKTEEKPEKKTEYIEIKTETSGRNLSKDPIKLGFDKDEDINILKKDDTEVKGKKLITTSQLIKEDTDLISKNNEEESQSEAKKEASDKISKEDVTTLKDVKEERIEENKKANKLIKDSKDKDLTYDPDLASELKKSEEDKIYHKSSFVKDEE